MEITPSWSHSTFSPVLLLGIAVVISVVAILVARGRSRGVAATLGLSGALILLYLAGEHIPFVSIVAPKTFCFGDIGAVHILSFMLPAIAVSAAKLRRSPSPRAL